MHAIMNMKDMELAVDSYSYSLFFLRISRESKNTVTSAGVDQPEMNLS